MHESLLQTDRLVSQFICTTEAEGVNIGGCTYEDQQDNIIRKMHEIQQAPMFPLLTFPLGYDCLLNLNASAYLFCRGALQFN